MAVTAELQGHIILITGAGSGIGRATAIASARAGARVVAVVDMDVTMAEETARLVEREGTTAITLCVDVAEVNAVGAMVDRVVGDFGGLNAAFNNAGVNQKHGMTADTDPEEWDRVFRVNAFGLWLCMRAELRHMTRAGAGVIVNMASGAGLRTSPGQSVYVASKHAVVGLTRNAAIEYADQNIRINAVCPGAVNTPMMHSALASLPVEERPAALKSFAALHPMGRVGEANEVADAVIFLMSDRASFITGQCLGIDGGWTAR